MTPVSYLRTEDRAEPRPGGGGRLLPESGTGGRRSPARYVALAIAGVVLALIVAGALLLTSASATLSADPQALARVSLPFDGGGVQSISVHGRGDRLIPAQLRNGRIYPVKTIPAHELISVQVVVKRPGLVSWLAGKSQRLTLQLYTPSAALRAHYLTLRTGAPVTLEFSRPVQALAYGPPGAVRRHVLPAPVMSLALPRTAVAGTIEVAAAPLPWETSKVAAVSWFPAGAPASAVASPAPGSSITPHTPIVLTFSRPISQALGSVRPPVSPITPGRWHTLNSHTIEFRPEGYGYGLSANVTVGLPSKVQLVGSSSADGHWTVPGGSPLRMQQILAQLGYLPFKWTPHGTSVANDAGSQEEAAVRPPAGSFQWRYPNVPAALKALWSPGTFGVVTRGALMAFQNDHGLAPDGSPGPQAWKALLAAAIDPKPTTFGYTFVMVSESAQQLNLWHSGHTVLTTAVNTGIASAPTATGTYPVFEHIPVGTMSGTNPDGSHYDDPGIQYISYFNGGDALHAFTRAQYGFPQSLGCVEMATGPAGRVYPYTPIGTLVHVA